MESPGRFGAVAFGVVALTCLGCGGGRSGPSYTVIVCGADAGSDQPDAVAGATWIDTTPYDPKSQMADIVDVGPDAFVVGYVHASFHLRYALFGADGVPQSVPAPVGARASWLRANSAPSWTVGGCDESYFAIDLADSVRLDTHRRCGGSWGEVTQTIVDTVDLPARPSLATRGTPDDGALLFVYGKGHQLLGRMQRFRAGIAGAFGAPFVILQVAPDLGVFSTDVIYNQHSDRFIVGEIERSMRGCRIQNAVLAVDADLRATVETVRQFGGCDTEAGGHHTAVAYNPSGDGSYLWWRQDGPKFRKAVYVHDRWGAATAIPSLPTFETVDDPPSLPERYTVPIASTGQTGTGYVLLKANIDETTVTSGLYGYSAGQPQPWSLLDVPPPFRGQVALRYVGGRSVGLMRGDPVQDVCMTADLFLVTSDRP
jgi:hypothetical protein